MVSYYSTLCATYFKNTDGETFKLSLGQEYIFKYIYEREYRRVAIKTVTQYGKLISDDTPVLTDKGWKNHGDLIVGDYVFNHKGDKVRIKDVLSKGIANVKVTFSNGTFIKVHENHEWLVENLDWKEGKVLETNWFFKHELSTKRKVFKYKLPSISPLNFEEKNLLLDPYSLGVWLGDGVTTKPSITINPKDELIIKSMPYKVSARHIHKVTGVVSYDFYRTELLKGLRSLGLVQRFSGGGYKGIGKKFIPDIFKQADIKQRLELLAGLIDTDGYVFRKKRKNGNLDNRVYICNSNKVLIQDVEEIVRSLGMRTSITKVKAHLSSSGINGKKDVYYLGFTPILDIPTRLERKRVFIHRKLRRLTFRKIEKIKPEQGNCINVDSKDGIYLVGRELIPTHNSEVASLAILALLMERKEKILIIAPSGKQAGVLMGKIIDHLFDHRFIAGMVDFSKTAALEKLRQSKSKTHLSLKNGSEVMSLTADVDNLKKEARSLMGFGATIVVIDEASLIPDTIYSKILRMVGGTQGKIVKLGNPFENNHFGKSFQSKRYTSLTIDYRQALREGRLTQEFLDEAQEDMTPLDWIIFYEVKFPDQGADNSLIPRAWIDLAVNQDGCDGDFKQSGLDVARFGRDKTVYILRKGGQVRRIDITEKMDTMEVAGWTLAKLQIDKPDRHCTDVVGVGAGVHDRLEELQQEGSEHEKEEWSETDLDPVNVGESAIDKDSRAKYQNLRAQIWFHMRKLFKPDGKTNRSQISIPDDKQLKRELSEIKYMYSSEKKRKIEPKDEMKKRLGYSPDRADALALAFWDGIESEPQLFVASG